MEISDLEEQLSILNKIQKEYFGLTIECIIKQLESRLKYYNNKQPL